VSGISFSTYASDNLEKVSLQLDWKYQFQFAGFIAAKEKGFYQDVGLDVDLIEYQNSHYSKGSVLRQEVNYGLSKASVYIEDGALVPTKILATYFHQSPLVLATQKEIRTPHDLMGMRLEISDNNVAESPLGQLLSHFYLNDDNTTITDPSYNLNDFVEGKVDATAIFRTNQLFELEQRQVKYNIIDPADYGYKSAIGNLYTSVEEYKQYPVRTQNFVNASKKGWEYALANKEEIISLIYEQYSNKKSIEALRYEAAELEKLMLLDSHQLGELDHKARLLLVDQLRRSGQLLPDQRLEINQDDIFLAEHIAYMTAKKSLLMCVLPDRMPLESVESDVHIGIVADVMRQFSNDLPIPIHLVSSSNSATARDKMEQRDCDFLSSDHKSDLRKKSMDFTSSYIDLPLVLATKVNTPFINNIVTVKDRKIGVIKGDWLVELLNKKYPNIQVVEVSSVSDGLYRVENGELFGYIDALMVISSAIQKEFTGQLKVSSRLDELLKLSVATRNDEPLLAEIFELLVLKMDKQRLQPLYNKWVFVKEEIVLDYSQLWRWAAVSLIFILFIVTFGWKRAKHKAVELQLVKYKAEQENNRRMQSEKALDDANNLLRTVLDSIPMRVFWKDKDLNYLGANTVYSQDAGTESAQELIGKSDYDFIWKNSAMQFRANDRGVMDTGEAKLNIEEPFVSEDARVKWIRSQRVPLKNSDNEIVGVLGVFDDITEQKKMEADAILAQRQAELAGKERNKLQEINKKLTIELINTQEEERRFIAQELHDEFGQILTALRMRADYLATMSGVSKEVKEGSLHIETMARELIDRLRLTTRKLRTATLDHLGLNAALEELISDWQQANLATECKYDLSSSHTLLDERYNITIYRLVQESLTNITKHAKASEVSIKLDINDLKKTVVLTIKDNGRGLQIDGESVSKHDSGLGLAGMKERVKDLGGYMEIYSDSQRKGLITLVFLSF